MRTYSNIALICLAASICLGATALAQSPDAPRFQLELEGGPVWQSRNDVQIPNDASGTRFSLVDCDRKWSLARIPFLCHLEHQSQARPARVAGPIQRHRNGHPVRPGEFCRRDFRGRRSHRRDLPIQFLAPDLPVPFPSRPEVDLVDRFYRQDSGRQDRPGSIRRRRGKTDVGFVPLLHLAADWRFGGRWSLDLDADALAGGPGRAEDVALKLRYRFDDSWSLAGGYRTVEGGADVDEVYNFAWLHYAVLSIRLGF